MTLDGLFIPFLILPIYNPFRTGFLSNKTLINSDERKNKIAKYL